MISQAKKNEIITTHAKKFAAKFGGGTPILEGVHYAKNGSRLRATGTDYSG